MRTVVSRRKKMMMVILMVKIIDNFVDGKIIFNNNKNNE
jgi:hypothetical protein